MRYKKYDIYVVLDGPAVVNSCGILIATILLWNVCDIWFVFCTSCEMRPAVLLMEFNCCNRLKLKLPVCQ